MRIEKRREATSGLVRLNVIISRELRRALRVKAASQDRSIARLVRETLAKSLTSEGR